MSIFSWMFGKKTKKKSKNSGTTKQRGIILVISGGGFRGAYALGIMKAMEEKNIYEKLDAIYGVSIGAIVGSLRANGIKADKIFKLLTSISVKDFYGKEILHKSGGLVSNKKILSMFDEFLPERFNELKIPFYAGVVDTNTAEFMLLNSGDLRKIVLGSMSIPGVFPPVPYEGHSLVDGGVLNNFPVDLAKKRYPNHEIIGIALNKFKTNQKIKSAIENLTVNFEVMMRSKLIENSKKVDYLFYRELPIGTLSLNKKDMQEAFKLGYEDGINMFSK